MSEIILVQHCQSEHHINNLTGGWTDTPLTELGKKQANLIGSKLAKETDIDKYILFSSDLQRAKQTAEIIGTYIKKDVIENKGLREINNGIAAGKTKEWASQNRRPKADNKHDLDHLEFDGGETWRQLYNRVSNCMEIICTQSNKLIIVTHGCALGYIVSWWMKYDSSMLTKSYFAASAGSISKLKINNYQQNVLQLFNDTSHL
jgi:probable phosphoglycerate mutase